MSPFESTACAEFRAIAQDVQKWLIRQSSVGEESLTDWFLYQLSERIPWVHYRKFTHAEEARETGADWEWWFVGRSGAIGMRIQAKRLRSDTRNYQRLAYPKASGKQIRRFLKASKQRSLPALYVLYCAHVGYTRCGAGETGNGIYLAEGIALYRKIVKPKRTTATIADLISLSNPFECFVCCPITSYPGVIGIWRYLEQYYAGVTKDLVGMESPDTLPEAPTYVTELLRGGEAPTDEWELRFAEQLQDVKALLVFDLARVENG